MKKFIVSGAVALLFVGVAVVPSAQAEEHSMSVYEQIQALLAQVDELQKELAKLQGEIKTVIKDGLEEGMTDEDIAEIQELLATDPSLYPEGLVTGYFGPLTREAIKRFQNRHDIEITGEIDEPTRELFRSYLDERYGGKIPPGLLRAPGIMKKVEYRFVHGGNCDDKWGKGPLCKKLKMKYKVEVDDDDDDDSDELKVEIEIEDDKIKVEVEFEGTEIEFELEGVFDLDMVLDKVDELLEEDLADELIDAIEEAYEDAVADNEEEEEENEAMEDAQDALDDAADKIAEAHAEIDAATGDTTTAEEKLQLAEDKLVEAQTAFDNEEYEDAETLAEEARDLAGDAKDLAELAV